MVSKSEVWVFDWNRIARSHSQMMIWHNSPLLTMESSVAQWSEPTVRSQRVVCSNLQLKLRCFSE